MELHLSRLINDWEITEILDRTLNFTVDIQDGWKIRYLEANHLRLKLA